MTDQQLFWLLAFILLVFIIVGRRKHSRYIRKKTREAVWSKFVDDFQRKNRGKAPRREDYEFDHIVAHSKGGDSRASNLRVLSKKQNRKKGTKRSWESY